MRSKSVVLQSRKKLQVLEKKIFQKKFLQLTCADMIFKTVCAIFFKSMHLEIFKFSLILSFQKMVLHNKIINKTRLTKNQENSAQSFVDNYLTNHLVKFVKAHLFKQTLFISE